MDDENPPVEAQPEPAATDAAPAAPASITRRRWAVATLIGAFAMILVVVVGLGNVLVPPPQPSGTPIITNTSLPNAAATITVPSPANSTAPPGSSVTPIPGSPTFSTSGALGGGSAPPNAPLVTPTATPLPSATAPPVLPAPDPTPPNPA